MSIIFKSMCEENIKEEIIKLKRERNALIVAHYYTNDEVQEIADYVGDSYYLSKIVRDSKSECVVFAGVKFMAESAKILSPNKTILLPDLTAGCPMAEMAIPSDVEKVREDYKNKNEELAVVCYINSTVKAKACSDVIVTSSNAIKVISKLKEKNIYFIPDENLGRYIASKIKDKNFIFHDGYCHVHTSIELNRLLEVKEKYPNAKVLAHPECKEEILKNSDFIGSTSEIIDEAVNSNSNEFIIATELGVLFEIKKRAKEKKLFSIGIRQFCPNMKKISLENILASLEKNTFNIEVEKEVEEGAKKALLRMHELAD